MTLFRVTVLGRELFSIGSNAAAPQESSHFDGYEYKCYLCGEMLVRRETPLVDRDLADLCNLHACEE